MLRLRENLLLLTLWLPLASHADEAIIDAADDSDIVTVEKLLSQGVDVNIQGEEGESALHKAAFWNDVKMAKLLIGKGAMINVKNIQGRTPLHFAAYGGQMEIATYLLIQGADAGIEDDTGHLASELVDIKNTDRCKNCKELYLMLKKHEK